MKWTKSTLALLLCMILFACLLPAAWADSVQVSTFEQLQGALAAQASDIILLSEGDVTLTGNLTIPNGVSLDVSTDGSLIVPAGKTLTVNGSLKTTKLRIAQGGSVIVNNWMSVMSGGLEVLGSLTLNDTWCAITKSGWNNLDATQRARISYNGDAGFYVRYAPRTDEAAQEHLNTDYGPRTKSTVMFSFDYTITGSITVPQDAEVRVTADLKVAPGVALTNNGLIIIEDYGTLAVDGTLVNDAGIELRQRPADMAYPRVIVDGSYQGKGGFIVYDDTDAKQAAYSNLRGIDMRHMSLVHENTQPVTQVNIANIESFLFYDNFTDYDFPNMGLKSIMSAQNPQQVTLYGLDDFVIEEDLTIPEGCYVKVRGGTIVVPAGVTLTVDGKLDVGFEGEIDVAGKLTTTERQGQIDMIEGDVIDVSGTFENNNYVMFGSDEPEPQGEPAPRLIIEDGATYSGGALRIHDHLNTDEVIQGIDMSDYCYHISNKKNEIAYYPGEMLTFEPMFPEGGKYISYLEVHGIDTYTLQDDVEIPVFDDGTVSRVNMRETDLVVPNGITLTVNGELTVRKLDIEQGGSVIVNEGGHLTARGRIATNDGACITVNDAVLEGGYNSSLPSALSNASFTGDAVVRLYSRLIEPQKAQRILDEAVNVAAIEHVEAVVNICCDWTIPADVTLPNRVSLEVAYNENGILTIPQGKTLTVSEGAELHVWGSDLTVNGILVNNGKILLGGDEHAAEVVLGVKGIYCGSGLIDRMNQPYMIINNKNAADMILPESLQTIESEALAGGVFTSVYIPPTVTAIAPDAFGDRTDLIILGTSGGYAETFAGLKHFTFVPAA